MRIGLAMVLALGACSLPALPRLSGDGGSGDARPDAPPEDAPPAACAATCGPSASTNCCASSIVPGNAIGATMAGASFFRSYDVATDGMFTDKGFPATVSDFRLDTYEVTVGRFRVFVNAGWEPRKLHRQQAQVHTKTLPAAAGTRPGMRTCRRIPRR